MNLEEFRKNRKARLEALHEELSNMPELTDDKAHGEVGAVEMDAIKSSKERDEKVKDSFKDKNKETKEFIKKQDKDREVEKEDKSENRLMLDESLFTEDYGDELQLALIFGVSRDGYTPSQVAHECCTARELRDFLDDYNDDTLIILSHDNGYTYGPLHLDAEEVDLNDMEESLEESKDLKESANEWEQMEIVSKPYLEDDDYDHSELTISHDGGKDKELIRVFNQLQELHDLSISEVFSDYQDKYL